jgi:hypothetical protein
MEKAGRKDSANGAEDCCVDWGRLPLWVSYLWSDMQESGGYAKDRWGRYQEGWCPTVGWEIYPRRAETKDVHHV